ncbi:ALQxL family class IV lanthipeptide [Kitasatospora paranensis]|uniref:ALQxL family class IV lanthipeptide n=1 Tax=Kitasatospora paranensis TaxID=258053 RepID=A0ABW2FTV2_9ACTN
MDFDLEALQLLVPQEAQAAAGCVRTCSPTICPRTCTTTGE